MSLKDFFKNSSAFDSSKFNEIESNDELAGQFTAKNQRYVPEIDYSNPSNFVRYGMAEEYYKDCVTRILEFYPYDGSTNDKLKWENDSLDIDLYIYKNLWPKTTGYVNFSANGWGSDDSYSGVSGHRKSDTNEYIYFVTGPNSENTYESSSISRKFSNVMIDRISGNTVEFWLKKSGFPDTDNECRYIAECILDMSPVKSLSETSAGSNRFTISIFTGSAKSPEGSTFITPNSGYAGVSFRYNTYNTGVYDNSDLILLDGLWHHYSLSFKALPNPVYIDSKVYRDGVKITEKTFLLSNTPYLKPMSGTIGSLLGGGGGYPPSTNPEYYTGLGYGKLSGSLDEFRIWNCVRTSEQIKEYYNTFVNGGTNNKEISSDLGLYYKFNEGITGITATDSVVLDYSGRATNGLIIGYNSNFRSTGSAIEDAEASSRETKDPIIYEEHPDVVSLKTNLISSGSIYDEQNSNNIYGFVPSWIIRETEDLENNTTKNILHIASTILDELYIKTEKIVELRSPEYKDNTKYSINPFVKKILSNYDLDIPELFSNPSLFEQFFSKKDELTYEENITNIRNFLYKNIYNNLINIYKSKGTEYSLRNTINALGINTNLVKLNLYANNETYDYDTTNYEQKIVKKKYLKFSTNNNAYLSKTINDCLYGVYQAEVDLHFPKYNDLDSSFYNPSSIMSSSVAYVHTEDGDLQCELIFVKENLNSKNGYFVLQSAQYGEITSDLFYDVYDNKRWLILFGVRDKNFKNNATLMNSYGSYLHCLSENDNKFYTGSAIHPGFTPNNSYFRIGAINHSCDIDIGSARLYAKNYGNSEEGYKKYFDVSNYGTLFPHQNYDIGTRDYIPQQQTTVLNWVFDTITGSDSSGKIYVEDFNNGSPAGRYIQNINSLTQPYGYYPVTGSDFEPSSTSVVETKYIVSNQQKLPENVCSSDMVRVISAGSYENFRRDSRPINYIYSLERSYFQNISQEMINLFSSILAFNNILGEPVQKYRTEYKSLNKLRNLFFEKVQNIPDIEKYVDFYKWIDKSVTEIISNLIPASTNIIEDNEVIVESHLLERSKYRNKFTNFRNQLPDFLVNIKGIGESDYRWDNLGTKWTEYRKERSVIQIPVESGSNYYQKYDNVYDIDLSVDYKNQNSYTLQNSSTIDFDILQFNSIKPNRPGFDWASVNTVEYWDIYSLDYPNATPVPQIIGNYAGLVMTGSRTSYSGSFYGPTYSEASNYPRSAWLTGSGTTVKKCISRAYNATADYAITYRVNGINPLSGSTNFTTYYVVGIYPGKAYPLLQAQRSVNDGYFTPPREIVLSKTTADPGKITLSYVTQGGSSYTAFGGEGSDLIYHQFYLIVLIKNGLRFSIYTVGEGGFTYFIDNVDIVEEIWPCSDNLNIIGYGTNTTSGYVAENASFTWVSLHDDVHTVSKINVVINQINRKQGFNFVQVS